VRDERGVVVAAIGVTGPIELFPLVATAQVATLVKQAALTVALSTYRPELLANAQ
jgi:IclR family acetate operon transcriptional repressor